MKSWLFATVSCLLLMAVTLLALEGGYSLLKYGKPHLSVTYQALSQLGLTRGAKGEEKGSYAPYFADAGKLSSLIPLMRDSGIGVGNSPFKDVVTDEAAINTTLNGCPTMKPGLRKIAFHLRSSAFNPFDPITIFYNADKKLDPRLASFFDRYGSRRVTISTNAEGERVTEPRVDRLQKVLVAGDSVAFGAMIDDKETLSSELQRRDNRRQYVNLGVAGIDAEAIVCRLEAAAQRYHGTIDEVIYVYCENDFQPNRPFGRPDAVVNWLKAFAARERITKITIVFSPYIYTIAPELSRFDGYFGATYPYRATERLELRNGVQSAGFGWIDIGLLAREEEASHKNPFAMFGLFVDHNHLSPDGVRKLADKLDAR